VTPTSRASKITVAIGVLVVLGLVVPLILINVGGGAGISYRWP